MIASTHISSAAFLTLFSSPVEIVPAPGANKILIPFSGFGIYRSGAVAYSFDGADDISIQFAAPAYNGWPVLKAQSVADTMVDAGFDSVFTLVSQSPSDIGDVSGLPNFINQPLQVALLAAADPTDGDGTLDIVLSYAILDLA